MIENQCNYFLAPNLVATALGDSWILLPGISYFSPGGGVTSPILAFWEHITYTSGVRYNCPDRHHEVSDAFTKVSDLNPDVSEEGIPGPSLNDHDYLRVYSC